MAVLAFYFTEKGLHSLQPSKSHSSNVSTPSPGVLARVLRPVFQKSTSTLANTPIQLYVLSPSFDLALLELSRIDTLFASEVHDSY